MLKHRAILAAVVCALLATALRADVPRPAGEFTFRTPDGKTGRLSAYKGKPLVLMLMLTTCPHCRKTVGFLSGMAPQYTARGLEIVAVAIEQDAAKNLPGFISTVKPPFPMGYNTDQKTILDFIQHPPSQMLLMPVLVFIDAKGMVRAQYEGNSPFMAEDKQEENLRKELDSLTAAGKKSGKSN